MTPFVDRLFLIRLACIAIPLFAIQAPAPVVAEDGEPVRAEIVGPADLPPRMEARLTDGSVLKLTLLDAHLKFKTDYGELRIPAADVRRIDFATRISDELVQQIAAAVEELGADDYDVRERASAKLENFGAAAYPALLKAAEHDDLEVVHRAERLLSQIRESLPAEQYEVRTDDVVQTAKSKIAGRITVPTLLVATEAFGKQELKLTLLRSLRSSSAGAVESKTALPDPGSLSNYQGQVGKVFRFQVTGGVPAAAFAGGFVGGAVWGSDVYTLDSTLALAAVHAGALKSGETGVVTVTILGPQNAFQGSSRHGVTTSSWGPFPGAFKFSRDEESP
jgi:hypothetical protein